MDILRGKKNFSSKIILLFIFISMVLSKSALGYDVVLNWEPNTEGDLAGYKLYYGTGPGSYNIVNKAANDTNIEVTGLATGEIYVFALTAYDKAGNEGAFSEMFSINVVANPPTATDPPNTISSHSLWGRKDGIGYHWTRQTFPTSFSNIPYVYANIDSKRGKHNAILGIKDVSRDGFWVRLEKDPAIDGRDTSVGISWLAVETPPSGWEVGSIDTDHNWVRVNFSRSYSAPPEVIANIVTENEADPSHVDIRDVTSTGFDVRVEENAGMDGTHTIERIDWLALETVSMQGGALSCYDSPVARSCSYPEIEIGEVMAKHRWMTVNFGMPFTVPPAVLATIKTENEGDSSHVDINNVSLTGFKIRIEEDAILDGRHALEKISWVALNRDMDGNGLPQEWELFYFNALNQDPNGDPDGDGLTNVQEYQLGKDPTQYNLLSPDTRANGRKGAITLTSNDNLSLTIALNTVGALGQNADWWLAVNTPLGLYWYNVYSGSWGPDLPPGYQSPVFNLGTVEVLNISGLPTGTYTLYFGIDTMMNGTLDVDQLHYDSMEVYVDEE